MPRGAWILRYKENEKRRLIEPPLFYYLKEYESCRDSKRCREYSRKEVNDVVIKECEARNLLRRCVAVGVALCYLAAPAALEFYLEQRSEEGIEDNAEEGCRRTHENVPPIERAEI